MMNITILSVPFPASWTWDSSAAWVEGGECSRDQGDLFLSAGGGRPQDKETQQGRREGMEERKGWRAETWNLELHVNTPLTKESFKTSVYNLQVDQKCSTTHSPTYYLPSIHNCGVKLLHMIYWDLPASHSEGRQRPVRKFRGVFSFSLFIMLMALIMS